MDHDDDIIRLRIALEQGLPVPKDIAQWLCKGFDNFEAGYCRCVCTGLGLVGPGIKSKKNRNRIQRRDKLLKWAVDTCYSEPGEAVWDRCKRLAGLIKRYPRSKSEHPLLQHIYDVGIHVPDTPEQIYKRVKPLLKMQLAKK